MNTLLTTILKKYKLFPTNILALGDEELSDIASWGPSHQIRGIVSSRELVDQGKVAHPTAKLYAQKLESYRITGLMQLTYAIHGQLNTIPTAKRGDIFATISKHSSPYALVVVDMKLPTYYESQTKGSSTPQITHNAITVDTWQHKKDSYIHQQMKLEAIADQPDLYRKTQTVQQYYSMATSDIKKLAGQYFETVTITDIKGKIVTKSTDHIIITCQKGGPDWKPKISM